MPTPITFFPAVESTIPHALQEHLRLIYSKLNDHARAFELLPKSSTPQPITTRTFYPKVSSKIPRDVARHLNLVYRTLNVHGAAFTQLPKVQVSAEAAKAARSQAQTFSAAVESEIPSEVQPHLQLVYKVLDNHARAFELYKSAMPAA